MSIMGIRLSLPSFLNRRSSKPLPIETIFKLPSPLPIWPSGEGFASRIIDLGGGLKVCQVSSFQKAWTIREGGQDNSGVTFFEPSPIPEGFSLLGFYCQPNNKPLSGWVLAAKDDNPSSSDQALIQPLDYTLVWTSKSLKLKKENDVDGYVWLPSPPDGYKAIGHVITTLPDKPSLDKIRCVRSDLTDQCETDSLLWGLSTTSNDNGLNVYSLKPSIRGTTSMAVSVGTFIAQIGGPNSSLSISCLKNSTSNFKSMPNLTQIKSLFQAYSPLIYFHPDETYLPSSVTWLFTNGALLYTRGEESKPEPIEPNGSNLPQGGSNDGAYWLDLPVDEQTKEKVKNGDLQNSKVYLHIKPMFGATFTDIAIWVFYPFNGPAKAQVEFIKVPLGKIGEHVGDWEHVTLRISNFNGELERVYFSQHSKGKWVESSDLEFQNGNKPVTYASLHGHAFYPKPGVVLQGSGRIGIRNESEKSKMVMDSGEKYEVIAVDYELQGEEIKEPFWVNYFRKWGPNISYEINDEIKKVEKKLPGKLKSAFEKFVKGLPNEVLGEEGPTGPKVKNNWSGDEAS